MKTTLLALLLLLTASATAQDPDARQIVALANRDRAAQGLAPLQWDASLAAAALAHAQRMAQEGSIAHRYGGEPDLAERAAKTGAHFQLIEENIAVGQSAAQIHDGWMHSPGHHDNLMNPQIDHIGVGLARLNGVLYAVADYSQSVTTLTPAQVEAKVAAALNAPALKITTQSQAARAYCAGQPSTGPAAHFSMVWQSAAIEKLPAPLVERLASGKYHEAAIGACPPQSAGPADQSAFTAYRADVLLY
jgi:hypothetical protein